MRRELVKIWSLSALASASFLAATCSMGAEAVGAGLESALREAGWNVERLQDGSILLRQGSVASQEEEESEVVDAAVAEGEASTQAAVPWDRLRESGWRVEKGEEGSMFLYPPVPDSGTKEEPVEPSSQDEPKVSVMEGLDAQLAGRGWRVERTTDGALLLYPRATQAPAAQESASGIQPCRGSPSMLAESAKIALPVEQWSKAKEIAESWLTSVGAEGLRVGKIRRVLRVFVVSILDSNSPHRLRHQIAINSADGRVIVLN